MGKLNPVKEMMRSSSYTEGTSVGKTRKDKICDICGADIPKGSAHTGAKLYCDEYTQVAFCNKCEIQYAVQLKLMREGKYDTY